MPQAKAKSPLGEDSDAFLLETCSRDSHDRGSKGFCCLNISPWTTASTTYHHTRASPVPDLLYLSGNSYKGPGARSSRKQPALLPSWDLPLCNSLRLSVTWYPPPRDTAERNMPLSPAEMLPGTNSTQVRCSSPEAPGSLGTALGHLLSMPYAFHESALPAPAAQSQSKCTACPLWNCCFFWLR